MTERHTEQHSSNWFDHIELVSLVQSVWEALFVRLTLHMPSNVKQLQEVTCTTETESESERST